MKKIMRRFRSWKNGLKIAKKGKHCRFQGKNFEVDGHVEVGHACRFRNGTIFRTRGKGKIVFGNHSGTSFNVIIEAQELVQIGSTSVVTEYSVIRDTSHLIYGTDACAMLTPHITKPVIIGDNVFIGSRCYIHPGVTIGDGAILGVGSVVTEGTTIGPLEIWAGSPARKIGHRIEGVKPEKLKEAQELIEKQGIREDRYKGKYY